MTTSDEFGSALTAMIEGGGSFLFGTVGADGAPRATRAWAVSVVDAAARRLRVAVTADDATVVANLERDWVTFTGANVRTFRSLQMKGRVLAVEPPTVDDQVVMDEQIGAFFTAVIEVDNTPLVGLRRMLPAEVLMVDMIVDQEFDQTPGPSAGASLRAAP